MATPGKDVTSYVSKLLEQGDVDALRDARSGARPGADGDRGLPFPALADMSEGIGRPRRGPAALAFPHDNRRMAGARKSHSRRRIGSVLGP
jgi:hypothetical protein